MRTTKAIWGLSLISAAQIVLYTLIVAGMITPLIALTQVMVVLQSTGPDAGTGTADIAQFVTAAGTWFTANWPALAFGAVVLLLAWAGTGIYDVAATAGIIAQTEASIEGRPTSAKAGLGQGFAVWWRTIGLLAIAAIPTLVYLLAMALVSLFTVSLPLYRGELPNAAAMSSGTMLMQPLSLLTSIVTIPLAVLVALGLRFVVLQGREWRPALGDAWLLVKRRPADIALMYLIVAGIGAAISFVVAIPLTIVAVVFGVLIAVMVSAAGGAMTAPVVIVGCIAVVFVSALFLAVVVATLLWQSVSWTVFWRHLTNPDAAAVLPAPAPQRTAPAGYIPPIGSTVYDPQPTGGPTQ
jgi:hypothetical protein